MGALASQPATSAHTHNPSDSTAFALASASDRLVDLVIATMEWDRTVGTLTLLQRDVANSSDQRSVEREGAFLGVDDGVGDDEVASVVAVKADASSRPTPQPTTRPAPRPVAAGPDTRPQRRAEEGRAEPKAARVKPDEPGPEPQARKAEPRPEPKAAKPKAPRAPEPAPSAWNNAPHVTWYGPGFYGNTTACGQRYTRQIIGVAHRTLPCGTMVEFRWKGITATAPVIDRGPYGPASYVFDFSAALSCDVFKPRGVANACFTRQDVAWRVVSRRD